MGKLSLCCLLVAFLLLASFAEGKRYLNRRSSLHEGLRYRNIQPSDSAPEPQWFTQTVDHYDPLNNATFQQQYYVNDTYWSGPGGPIFLLLGGEGPIGPDDVLSHFVLPTYAQKFGALIISVEHRFYGKSMPAKDLSTQNLRLLNSPQALADYALFQQYMTQKYNAADSKWISFGGSYSGSLSAWYRALYPHMVSGAIATSAPVKAKLEFQEYFEVVQQSVGPQCAQRIRNVTDIVTKMLTTTDGIKQLEQTFNACSPIVTADDQATFMSSLTDGVCEIVQYNQDNNKYTPFNVDKMCQMILQGNTEAEMLASYAAFNAVFNTFTDSNCTSTSYQQMIQEMRVTDPSNPAAASRSWTWQTCVEYGYFQTGSAPATQQPFSPMISLDWFLKQCKDIFGLALTPSVSAVNTLFGSTSIRSSNIVFPNGSIDPWHILGVLDSSCKSEPTSFMNGTAHCADLYPPTPNDLPELTATRELEVCCCYNFLISILF